MLFSFHFQKRKRSLFSWFSGLVEMSMTPENHYPWVWIHQIFKIIQENSQLICWKILFSGIVGSQSKVLEKGMCPKCLRSVLSDLENVEFQIILCKKRKLNGNSVFCNSTEGIKTMDIYFYKSAATVSHCRAREVIHFREHYRH